MVRDNHPKNRKIRSDLARRKALRAPYDRILIVTEDKKSALNYFKEIQRSEKLSTANVQMSSSAAGTDPLSVVNYAAKLFKEGDPTKKIEPKNFDQIFAVFDRDDHKNYYSALEKARSLDKYYRNSIDADVRFKAIVSIPCFEIWLLLHYEDLDAPIHRDEVQKRLKKPENFPSYEKNKNNIFSQTRDRLGNAHRRSEVLTKKHNPRSKGQEPYTDISKLVSILMNLKSSTG